MSDNLKAVDELVDAARELFAGKAPEVQGAALADLTAMWLAGHVIRGDDKATKRLHEEMLKQHLKAMRALIPVNYEMTVKPKLKEGPMT
jgi:hemerythrin